MTSIGFEKRDAQAVQRYIEDALEELAADLDIRVEPLLGGDPRVDACASAGVLRIREYMLPVASRGHRVAELKARFVLCEEVAHLVLEQAGVPHGRFAEFVQELFAAWVQFQAVHRKGTLQPGDLVTTPLASHPPLYELGKHIGAALAGSSENKMHLERWLGDPRSDHRLRSLARRTLDRLTLPLTSDDAVDLYEALRHEYE